MSDLRIVSQIGRPSTFTEEIGREICRRLEEGLTLIEICKDPGMPTMRTVMDWADGTTAAASIFPPMYARARQMQLVLMGEELQSIADDATNDWMDRQVGDSTIRVVDHEHVQRSKLRIDTRKWLLSKLSPDRYGDRVAHQMLDEHGKPAKAGVTVIIDGAPSGGE